MPESASPRLGLIGPSGGDLARNGDDQIRAIIAALETVAVGYLPASAYTDRPAAAAGNANFLHAASDNGIVGYSTGSSWIDINPKDAAAGTASLRTLGAGAQQAAAGTDPRLSDTRVPTDGSVTLAKLSAAVQALLVPTGTVVMTAAATADAGFLLCDGSVVSRATYSDLFGRIGTVHGAGNGTSTFNLPDLRGRAPVGAGTAAGAAGATAHALGDKGGEEVHILTTPEIPSHAHIFNLPAAGRVGGTGWQVGIVQTYTGSVGPMQVSQAPNGATVTEVNGVQSNGGGGSHNNMQPYTAVNFQIKT